MKYRLGAVLIALALAAKSFSDREEPSFSQEAVIESEESAPEYFDNEPVKEEAFDLGEAAEEEDSEYFDHREEAKEEGSEGFDHREEVKEESSEGFEHREETAEEKLSEYFDPNAEFETIDADFGDDDAIALNEDFEAGITVDLRNPEFDGGVLTTHEGGVVEGPGIRIQARHIIYAKQDGIHKIEATDDVIIQYGEYLFVGEHVEYDFVTKTGVIYGGRSGIAPWYFGGRIFFLLPDGNYEVYDGYVTTSQDVNPGWKIETGYAKMTGGRFFNAKEVKFRFGRYPLFYLPRFKMDLNAIFDNPIRYNFRWGGKEGPRFGIIYEVIKWNRFRALLRFDYRITRGPGGGFETHYKSPDRTHRFEMINYFARDSSIEDPKQRFRYRFQGVHHRSLQQRKLTFDLSWDKLSDQYFATDYNDKGLELHTAGRTQLRIRKEQTNWIANLLTRVRVNNFQTIKQELPTFEASLHPMTIGNTGIITENLFKASYLDFVYANDQCHSTDFNSPRLEARNMFYRPFHYGCFNFTPHAGLIAIYYGNTPERHSLWATAGLFGGELNTNLHRFFGPYKHVVTPYARYDFETYPTAPPNEHYIFDITDGQYRLNMVRFGLRNNFYVKYPDSCVHRLLNFDLFANAFLDTPTVPGTIPKIYSSLTWLPTTRLKQSFDIAWDFAHNELDHINIRNEWTVSNNMALALEYRHRDRYDWRKVQKQNFILDSFRSVNALAHSQLSDRRDTLLLHFFWKYAPTWAFEFQSRSGWNRLTQPRYNEYVVNLIGTLSSAWNISLSYRHKEDEDRVAVYMTVGINRPDSCRPCFTPCLEF